MVLETAAYRIQNTYRIPATSQSINKFCADYSILSLLTLEKGEEATEECLPDEGLTAEIGMILKRF
jgi:hypothetical protein